MSKPEFHLRRMQSDGYATPVEIYAWNELPRDTEQSRRGFLRTAVALGAVLEGMGRAAQAQAPAAANTPSPQKALRAHSECVTEIAFSPDGRQVVSAGDDYMLKIWPLDGGALLHLQTIPWREARGRPFVITGDGRLVISDGTQVDLATLIVSKPDRKPSLATSDSYVIASDGSLLAKNSGSTIALHSLPAGTLVKSWRVPDLRGRLAISPDNRILALVSRVGLEIWSLPDGVRLGGASSTRAASGFLGILEYVAFTSDSAHLVTGHRGEDGWKIWSLPEVTLAKDWITEEPSGVAPLMSPDGKSFVTAGSATVKIWSLPTGRFARALTGMPAPRAPLAFSRDGAMLATQSGTGTQIGLWLVADGRPMRLFEGHPEPVTAAAFSPDGRTLATGDKGGTVILWDVANGRLRTYLFDAKASTGEGLSYNVYDTITKRTVTYTMPCGSPLPPGATCICNCVPGTFVASSPVGRGVSGGTNCICNKICTCIPVCQAHRLLHGDAIVRRLAEELLLVMGAREFAYMHWAVSRAGKDLRARILQIMATITGGATANPGRWPEIEQCVPYLDDPDEIVAIMAAQMIGQHCCHEHRPVNAVVEGKVDALLEAARKRPWHVRAAESGR